MTPDMLNIIQLDELKSLIDQILSTAKPVPSGKGMFVPMAVFDAAVELHKELEL